MTNVSALPVAWLLTALSAVGGLLGCSPRLTSSSARNAAPDASLQSGTSEGGAASWFTDVTTDWKLDFQHDPGPLDGKYFLPQINGSGAALLDYDNDGRLDLYLLQGGGPGSGARNALFRQQAAGGFENVSQESGLALDGTNTGVAVGDVNNDGWPDVVVLQYLGARLFLNQSGETFQEVTQEAGLMNPYWGTSASFVDYDRDGWLDLVIVNYVTFEPDRHCVLGGGGRDYCRPNLFRGQPTRLFRNRGESSSGAWLGLEDVTEAAGLARVERAGLGVLCVDLTGDGWPDILVANDMQANALWVNQQDGTFQEAAVERGLAYNLRGQSVSNMGVAYGDVDGNGLGDVFITLFTNERHGLWKQGPPGIFVEETAAAGITRAAWHGTGWGTVLADFDHSGALDVALVNGFVDRQDVPEHDSFWRPYQDRNQIFANVGGGQFVDVSENHPAFCSVPNVGRGLCVGDIDGDGALDLLVTQVGGPARILRNVAPDRGNWLMVRALDPERRRDAIGAEVRLLAGERRWTRVVQPAQSFQCSHDMRVHFGLGAVDRLEAIEVLWPDGTLEQFSSPGVNQLLTVTRGSGKPLAASPAGSTAATMAEARP